MLSPDVWMTIPRGFIRREGGEKEEKVSKGYGNNDAGEGEEREESASLEDASNNDEIYGAIASGQGTTNITSKPQQTTMTTMTKRGAWWE